MLLTRFQITCLLNQGQRTTMWFELLTPQFIFIYIKVEPLIYKFPQLWEIKNKDFGVLSYPSKFLKPFFPLPQKANISPFQAIPLG